MNKKIFSIAMSSILLFTGCSSASSSESVSITTAEASAESTATAETVNNAGKINLDATKADMSAYVFLHDSDPVFLEVTTEESLRLFVNGTGIVIYSYETCPWCNRVIPVLNEAAKEAGVTVFYVNIYSDDFMSKSNDEKSDIIDSLYTVLDPILERQTDEETGEEKAVMQVPEVVAVKDGEIVGHHLGVVDSFTLDQDNLSEYQVTDSQVEELKNIYLQLFKEIQ